MDRSDPTLGIVFTDLPDVTGDARSAVNTLTLFEVEAWRALTTGVPSPTIPVIATPEVVALVQAQLDGNAGDGWTLSGELHESVSIDTADAHTATAVVCQDWSEVVSTKDGVPHTSEELGEDGTVRFDVAMSRVAENDPWMVLNYEWNETC
jgi:hypothetical protein